MPVTLATEMAGGAANYGVLVLVVFVGSVLPVLPTGAAVSAAAALAVHGGGGSLAAVAAAAALAASAGDVLTFALARLGSRRVRRLATRGRASALEDAHRRLQRHGSRLIVLARLLPAARVPVLVAAGALRYDWLRFLAADAAAVVLWALGYAALGVAGGGAFGSPWAAAAAAAALVLAVEAAVHLVRRRRRPAPQAVT